MTLSIFSTFLDSFLDKYNIRKYLNFFNKKCFLIEIFHVDRRDAKCPTNVTIGNNLG